MRRIWIRRRRFWWSAIDPDESLATMDTHTVLRSWTREGVIDKAICRWGPQSSPWEEVVLAADPKAPTTLTSRSQEGEDG